MTRPVITLSVGEWSVAAHLSAMRQGINREAGRINQKAGPQDPMTTEMVGALGEIAFARWANVFPDLSVHLRSGSADAVWRGWKVDVKTSRNPNSALWLDPNKRPDVYVLALRDGMTITLAGWIPGHEAHERFTGQVPQQALYGMDSPPEPRGGEQ